MVYLDRGRRDSRCARHSAPAGSLQWSPENADVVRPHASKHGERWEGEPEALDKALLVQRAQNAFDLLRDLQLTVNESTISVAVLIQGAGALGDRALDRDLSRIVSRNERQRNWLLTRIRQAAPQTLIVPS